MPARTCRSHLLGEDRSSWISTQRTTRPAAPLRRAVSETRGRVRAARRGRPGRQPRHRTKSHVPFPGKYGLPFTLLADPEHEVAERYGVWVEKKNYGKTYWGVERSTFVIDADGKDRQGHAAREAGHARRRRTGRAAVKPLDGLPRGPSSMRMRGLEPPRPEGHTDLNRARLPIPPHPRGTPILAGTFSRSRTSHPVMLPRSHCPRGRVPRRARAGLTAPRYGAGGPVTEVVVTLASPPLARAGAGGAARIATEQRAFEKDLAEAVPGADVRWRYRIVANGFAVVLPGDAIPLVRRLPGVSRVFTSAQYRPSLDRSVPQIGAPVLWGPALETAGRRREDRDHRHGRRPDPSVLCPSRIHDAVGLPEGAARIHDGQGDRRPRISTAPSRRRRRLRSTATDMKRILPASPLEMRAPTQAAESCPGSRRAHT